MVKLPMTVTKVQLMDKRYTSNHLTVEQEKRLCQRAKKYSTKCLIEKLSEASFYRQRINMSYRNFYGVLYKNRTTPAKPHIYYREHGKYLQVCFTRSSNRGVYFMWLEITDHELIDKFIGEFNLKMVI